jgi:hypothetical protein
VHPQRRCGLNPNPVRDGLFVDQCHNNIDYFNPKEIATTTSHLINDGRWLEQQALKHIPVFLLSGSPNPKVCEEAKIIGARECFEKPSAEEHIRKVEEMVCEAA